MMTWREEVIGDCRLILGDCLEVMPTVAAVTAVITDPPYELSSAGPGNSHPFGTSLAKFESAAYRKIVSGFNHETVFSAIDGVCKPLHLFCFCSNKQISKFMAYHEARGRSVTVLVWHKVNAVPFANGVWRGDIEYCVHARDAGAVFLGNAEEKKKVSQFPIVTDASHPSVKPLDLMQKYVRISTERGQAVLDPFLGSGTTGVACAKLGRKFIGIEIEPKYFDIACRRIEAAYAQPDIFLEAERQVTPVQASIFDEAAA